MMQYRLSLDDNIWVFRDLAAARPASIFENEYLGFWRELHDRYGTKIQMNIYECGDAFRLSEMPEIWRDEWRAQADWLRLSFHAKADEPPSPYRGSGYDEVRRDCEAIHREILRFAGPESLSRFTTVHFTDVSADGLRALRDCGIRGLVGLFGTREYPAAAYQLPEELCRRVREEGPCFDPETEMWYFNNDLILNQYGLAALPRLLEERAVHDFCEIMIHEQYFLPDYPGYQSDYREKVETAAAWLTERGFQPAFLEEAVLA